MPSVSESPTQKRSYPEEQAKDHGLHRVLIDFDGVLATDTWPSPAVGEPIPKGIDILLHYAGKGYEVSIYTARPKEHLHSIHDFLWDNGLDKLVYEVICCKPRAWLYIDDRAWNPIKGGLDDFDC